MTYRHNRLVLAITCLVFVTFAPIAGADSSDLLLHYTFNQNNAKDASGNGHDGRIFGAKFSKGARSPGLRFDGIDDYVDLGKLDIDSDAMSIMAWMQVDSFSIADARIISKSTSTSNDSHYFMLSTISNHGYKLRFRLKTDDGFPTKTLIATVGQLRPGQWFHVAAVFDGQRMSLYRNGEEVGSTSKLGRVATNPDVSTWIGRNPDGERPFHGSLDDVRIYNKAVSEDEIQAIIQEAFD